MIVQSAISLVHACLRSSINLRKHFLSPLFLCRQSQRRFCAGAVRCCVMNGKARQSEDHVLARIFRISSQGRQMKAPVCVTILLSPSSVCQHFSSHRSDLIGWTSEAVCPFYLQLISAAFAGASSPWIFISPLTPLNVNSSFPVLLFISVAWWFDHAENTRLAIASSLVLPQGHLLLKCYCLCCLTLCTPAPLQTLLGRVDVFILRSPEHTVPLKNCFYVCWFMI